MLGAGKIAAFIRRLLSRLTPYWYCHLNVADAAARKNVTYQKYQNISPWRCCTVSLFRHAEISNNQPTNQLCRPKDFISSSLCWLWLKHPHPFFPTRRATELSTSFVFGHICRVLPVNLRQCQNTLLFTPPFNANTWQKRISWISARNQLNRGLTYFLDA